MGLLGPPILIHSLFNLPFPWSPLLHHCNTPLLLIVIDYKNYIYEPMSI